MKRLGAKRGRPAKFGRPSRVVALTLPEDVVRGLQRLNPDLAWAVVSMFEKGGNGGPAEIPDADLVEVGNGRALIAVNHATLRRLPGVHMIPINGKRALLSLEPGHGASDLELMVLDRLERRDLKARERQALEVLRDQLRRWRKSGRLRFYTRSIIEVERRSGRR